MERAAHTLTPTLLRSSLHEPGVLDVLDYVRLTAPTDSNRIEPILELATAIGSQP